MNTTAIPRSIRATVHQDAISRVPGFFNATTREVLNELLQNSRRAGAARIDITSGNGVMTVTDDGQGIPDPAVVLAFGQSGWEDGTVMNEHPAGMGFYSLARRESVTVRSGPGDGTGWRVQLAPEHFVGEMEAPVEELSRDVPPGTSVTFSCSQQTRSNAGDVEDAARHYPLPVYHDGKSVTQIKDFLGSTVHVEEWQGVRIGVHHQSKQMNFHGIVIQNPGLPQVNDMHQRWTASVDVVDCPHLELTLPARKEIIETQFMDELRRECRRAIYRAMALEPGGAEVPFAVQQDARELGVDLPEAAARLRAWEAEKGHDTGRRWERHREKGAWVDGGTVLIDNGMACGDQHALERAARLCGTLGRLMEADGRLEGYGWYDRLTRMNEVRTTITQDGRNHDLAERREREEPFPDPRPERIAFTLECVDGGGSRTTIHLPSDLTFYNDDNDDTFPGNAFPLVTQGSRISPDELAEIMMDSFFNPNDGPDADSYNTQVEEQEEQYREKALALLATREEAARENILRAVKSHAYHHVPPGMQAVIRIRPKSPVKVELEPA